MTTITHTDRCGRIETSLTADDYKATSQAEPTSRLLSCDSEDHWAAQEWVEYGTIGGKECTAYYLFSTDDITDDDGNEFEEADMYPWDNDHLVRIVIDEE